MDANAIQELAGHGLTLTGALISLPGRAYCGGVWRHKRVLLLLYDRAALPKWSIFSKCDKEITRASLLHPCIEEYEMISVIGERFLAFALSPVRGIPLHEWVRSFRFRYEHPSDDRMTLIILDLLRALEYLHEQGYLHLHLSWYCISVFADRIQLTDIDAVSSIDDVKLLTPDEIFGSCPLYRWATPEWFSPCESDRGLVTREMNTFGIGNVIWALHALEEPFAEWDRNSVQDRLKKSWRLPAPVGMSHRWKEIMSLCWASEKQSRPNCKKLLALVQKKDHLENSMATFTRSDLLADAHPAVGDGGGDADVIVKPEYDCESSNTQHKIFVCSNMTNNPEPEDPRQTISGASTSRQVCSNPVDQSSVMRFVSASNRFMSDGDLSAFCSMLYNEGRSHIHATSAASVIGMWTLAIGSPKESPFKGATWAPLRKITKTECLRAASFLLDFVDENLFIRHISSLCIILAEIEPNKSFIFQTAEHPSCKSGAHDEILQQSIQERQTNSLLQLGISLLRTCTEQGFGPALYTMGIMCATGQHVDLNMHMAEVMLLASARSGYARAWVALGHLISNLNLSQRVGLTGQSYEKDREENESDSNLISCCAAAAEYGDPIAMTQLGDCYFYSIGTHHDPVSAFHHYRSAAQLNYPVAIFKLANMYSNGCGVPHNIKASIIEYNRVCDVLTNIVKTDHIVDDQIDSVCADYIRQEEDQVTCFHSHTEDLRDLDAIAQRWYQKARDAIQNHLNAGSFPTFYIVSEDK